MATSKKRGMRIRRWREEDIPAIVACHEAAYPDYVAHFDERIHRMQLVAFPEGQILAEKDGRVVGYATSLIVQLEDDAPRYTYMEITGGATFSTHDPSGDTLYGADIAVHPDLRGQGIAALLYERRMRLLKRYNLRRMVAYGRLPTFNQWAGKLTADEYVEAVVAGRIEDPALRAHLKAGYQVKGVKIDLMGDASSLNYSTLLEMPNPDFQEAKRRIASAPVRRMVRKIRVCAAQYLMRRISSWDEFEQNVEFFVDTADEYHCHFLLFPELFTAQLFSTMPAKIDSVEAMRRLSEMTERYVAMFRRFAQERGLYIIGGSQPVLREGLLYNVAHLFTPSGNIYTQDKLHITPAERKYWNIVPGEGMNVFETPLGRIAIQICYDIEFPEVSRLMMRAGAQAIFVPFSTDEKKAYLRVRYTAQARAVENSLYVVLAGNVGNLPSIRSYLINYGQAAVFTPSDVAFPPHGTLGEAEPNVETVVIADLDINSLDEQREVGSVRPFYDQRPDLYELRAKERVRIVRVE